MESISNFNKGMDLDTNPLNLEAGKYREADNIRLVNDVGGTSFSVNNIKGNEYNITIPSTEPIYKIEIIGELSSQYIVIDYGSGTPDANTIPFDTTGMTYESLYNAIISDPGYTALGSAYNVYYGNSSLIVIPITPFSITLSVGGAFYTSPTPMVPAQSNLSIIGSIELRGDIYLFTTNNTSLNPGGHDASLSVDPSSAGQIWKYTYDKITLAGSLKLIYNNFVDFSTYYAIAPTATTSRYENSGTQRVYWTDNYNRLRSINVSDPQSLALDLSVIDVIPAVDFDIPILTDIRNVSGNTVKVGVYQCAYRLTNTGGALTNFSELSNMVYVVPEDEAGQTGGANWKKYKGYNPGTVTNKNITWTIKNIDLDYDRIEIVIVYKEHASDVHSVISIQEHPLTSDEYKAIYTGTETAITIPLAEFLSFSGLFTHCKTIGTKDNRLFVANVKNKMSDIEFDCRAYRWHSYNALDLTENGSVNPYVLTPSTVPNYIGNIVNNSDAINANQSVNKYKADGLTLGGEGINVSYTFETTAIQADIDSVGGWTVPDCTPSPWRHTNPRYFGPDYIDLNVVSPANFGPSSTQKYPSAVPFINDGFKYPHISGLLRGYQRGETYRFGVQFFDKRKVPMFVQWIGDIKMPDFNDLNINSKYEDGTPTGINDFRLGFIANKFGQNCEYVQSLGINFTIKNLETLSDKICGYSIVRLKRETKDRTIVCQGYITKVDLCTDSSVFFSAPTATTSADLSFVSGWSGTTYAQRGWFSTPQLSNLDIVPDSSMSLNIKAILTKSNAVSAVSTGGTNPYLFCKWYGSTNVPYPGTSSPFTSFDLDQITYVGYAGTCTDDAGTPTVVNNYDFGLSSADTPSDVSQGVGNPAFFFRVNGTIQWQNSDRLLIANVERVLSNQYGGNSYSERAASSYISCGHFRPIRISSLPINDNFSVYNGDIYTNVYDSCRMAKNFGNSGRLVSSYGKSSTTFFYPVECNVNTDLRNGYSMNYDFGGTSSDLCSPPPGYEAEFKEDYNYNVVYSSENDVKTYFPKPDPFILNEEFDNRVYASEIKINGEAVDSWSIFKIANYWDVEGTYGPINAIDILRDKMYFWQNRAFGILQINPRAIVTDVNNPINSQLQLGTGLVLQRHDYISTEVGMQHQWGVTKSSYSFIWADIYNKKMYTYSDGNQVTPESDIKGIFSFLNNNIKYNIKNIDKPTYVNAVGGVNGIRAVYDFKYNQAIFTFSDSEYSGKGPTQIERKPISNSFTIVYDERIGAFTSFYGFKPLVYMTDGYKIFSPDPNKGENSNIYMHDVGRYCKFYGTVLNSDIKIVINDHFQYTKAFDNIMYDSQAIDTATGINYNDDTWNQIRVYNDYQNTNYQALTTLSNIKRKERTWQLAIPRNRVLYTSSNSPNIFTDLSPIEKLMGERMRDKYIIIDLIYNNVNNRNLSFNNLRTIYRQSPR
jgi:hypothetical protein